MAEAELRRRESSSSARSAVTYTEPVEQAALNASPARLDGVKDIIPVLNYHAKFHEYGRIRVDEGLIIGDEHYEAGQSRQRRHMRPIRTFIM
jgi:hypothetical protein